MPAVVTAEPNATRPPEAPPPAAAAPHVEPPADAPQEPAPTSAPERAIPAAGVVGLAIPLTGRLRIIGEAVLTGALLGMNAFVSGDAQPRLEIADSAPDSEGAVRELATRGASVIVGGLDAAESYAIAMAASQVHLGHVSLVPPDASARARLLATEAARQGLRRVAALAPQGDYGDAVLEGFRLGQPLTGAERYAADTTNFDKVARALCALKPDGVFVGDSALRLEMIAPALVAAGCSAQIFSTAEGVSAKVLRAKRYLQNALFAPGFFPDSEDATTGPFTAAFVRAHGVPPRIEEALGYAAAREARGLEIPRWPRLYQVIGEQIRARN